MAQSYLIGQFGKIDGYDKKIGNVVINYALNLIKEANRVVGCRVIRLDCVDALVNYYEKKRIHFSEQGR